MILSAFLSLFFLLPYPVEAQQTPPEPPAVLTAALVPICSCESTGKRDGVPTQFNEDGTVIHGYIHYADTGMCQLNAEVWEKKAIDLGYDIYTEQGNIKMANWIYEQQGSKPWISSAYCWKK